MDCEYCGDVLTGEELESPQTDNDGDPICDDCHHEHFEFTCDVCEEYGDVEDQHNMIIVWDAEEAGIDRPGLYKIIRLPYYTQGLIGSGWIHQWAIKRIDNEPKKQGYYGCGHMCGHCQRQYLDMHIALNEMNSC